MKISYKLLNTKYLLNDLDIPDNYEAPISQFIEEYRNKLEDKRDIFAIIFNAEWKFLSAKEVCLYLIWLAQKYIEKYQGDSNIIVKDEKGKKIRLKKIDPYVIKKLEAIKLFINELIPNDELQFILQVYGKKKLYTYGAYNHQIIRMNDKILDSRLYPFHYASAETWTFDKNFIDDQIDELLRIFKEKEVRGIY